MFLPCIGVGKALVIYDLDHLEVFVSLNMKGLGSGMLKNGPVK